MIGYKSRYKQINCMDEFFPAVFLNFEDFLSRIAIPRDRAENIYKLVKNRTQSFKDYLNRTLAQIFYSSSGENWRGSFIYVNY